MKLAFVLLWISFFFSCISSPMNSVFYTNTTQNLNGEVSTNTLSSAKILRSGMSCSVSGFLTNLFFYGSGNSIEEAKKNAEITKIAVIDRSSLSVLGFLYYKECVIVWGE
jgi:hypothetical protein